MRMAFVQSLLVAMILFLALELILIANSIRVEWLRWLEVRCEPAHVGEVIVLCP